MVEALRFEPRTFCFHSHIITAIKRESKSELVQAKVTAKVPNTAIATTGTPPPPHKFIGPSARVVQMRIPTKWTKATDAVAAEAEKMSYFSLGS